MLPNGFADTAGHLPLRVWVISSVADVCWAGPHPGLASPLSPWVTAEEMKGPALGQSVALHDFSWANVINGLHLLERKVWK